MTTLDEDRSSKVGRNSVNLRSSKNSKFSGFIGELTSTLSKTTLPSRETSSSDRTPVTKDPRVLLPMAIGVPLHIHPPKYL